MDAAVQNADELKGNLRGTPLYKNNTRVERCTLWKVVRGLVWLAIPVWVEGRLTDGTLNFPSI